MLEYGSLFKFGDGWYSLFHLFYKRREMCFCLWIHTCECETCKYWRCPHVNCVDVAYSFKLRCSLMTIKYWLLKILIYSLPDILKIRQPPKTIFILTGKYVQLQTVFRFKYKSHALHIYYTLLYKRVYHGGEALRGNALHFGVEPRVVKWQKIT